MLKGFAGIFGDARRIHLVVSEEAATYRPEMEWLAKQLGDHTRASAEASGDLAHYEERDDLDPDDLCIEYWLGHYKSVVREAIDTVPAL